MCDATTAFFYAKQLEAATPRMTRVQCTQWHLDRGTVGGPDPLCTDGLRIPGRPSVASDRMN